MNSTTRYKVYIGVLALPFIVLLHLSTHLEMERHRLVRLWDLTDEHLVPPSDNVEAASLNYRTAAVDLLWLGAVLYASEQAIQRQPRRAITQYADTIIDLDPHFAPIYGWHNVFRYKTTLSPDYEDIDEANRILAKGLEYFPDNWTYARSIAINQHEAGYRLERTPEERIEDLERGLKYARLGAEMDDAPATLTGLAINFRHRLARLRAGHDEYGEKIDGHIQVDAAEIDFLVRRYFAAEDDQQRAFLREQLIRLGAEEELLEMIQYYERRYREAHGLQYAYLSPDLYPLVDTAFNVWHASDEFTGE